MPFLPAGGEKRKLSVHEFSCSKSDRIKQFESKHVKLSHLTIQHLKFEELRVTFIMPCNMF